MTRPRPRCPQQMVVDASPEEAFEAFTRRFGDFKPKEHNMLAAHRRTVFEPHVGGHIDDRAVDGSECRWARILAYEPPAEWYSAGTSARSGRSRPIPPDQ